MKEMTLFDNKALFVLYGIINFILIIALLILLGLFFNDIHILNRTGFFIFIGVHIFLLFFVKIHYLRIFYREDLQKIEFRYNRRFGLKWKQKSRTVLLPLRQFDGYSISKDSLGISVISFFKLDQRERFELGPFHIGFISKKEKENLESSFGESL
ncbi:MAG: hypothetical protein MI975_18140 [Cytophagales bacterium]|nr:hypothetical protein [Cytophagales bacterium]